MDSPNSSSRVATLNLSIAARVALSPSQNRHLLISFCCCCCLWPNPFDGPQCTEDKAHVPPVAHRTFSGHGSTLPSSTTFALLHRQTLLPSRHPLMLPKPCTVPCLHDTTYASPPLEGPSPCSHIAPLHGPESKMTSGILLWKISISYPSKTSHSLF